MVRSRSVQRVSLASLVCLVTAYSSPLAAKSIIGRSPANSVYPVAYMQCDAPSYNYFEQWMIRQANYAPEWQGYSYYYNSLRDRTVNGNACSGYYAVRWTYTYSYGQNGTRINGWVELRFRNGNLDCLTYSTTPGLCRPAS